MKINPGSIAGIGAQPYEIKNKKNGVKPQAAAEVDKIEIGAQQGPSTETFIEQLKAQIMRDVKAGVQPHELGKLREQVASGEYDLNIADIARRILCDFD